MGGLCINQNGVAERNAQIVKMEDIYTSADKIMA
jgi:hypothetical protein